MKMVQIKLLKRGQFLRYILKNGQEFSEGNKTICPGWKLKIFRLFFLHVMKSFYFICLFICAYIVWAISPPYPPPQPLDILFWVYFAGGVAQAVDHLPFQVWSPEFKPQHCWVLVVHACNPTFLICRGQEDRCSKPIRRIALCRSQYPK
jgi:hypothetical protein